MSETGYIELEEQLATLIVRDAPTVGFDELHQAARHVADLIGVSLAGVGLPEVKRLRLLTPQAPARLPGAARIWGTQHWAPLRGAGLLNGYAGHVHDFDDDEVEYSMAHVTVTAATSAIVCADSRPETHGRDVLVAYLVATEVALRLGEIINPDHYRSGWHASATLGCFAACAAAGRLLGLSSTQMRHALGISASLAAGLRSNFGSETKPLQVGQAVRNGIFAAEAAAVGMTSSPGSLLGPSGYGSMFQRGRDISSIIGGFGKPYRFLGGTMTIKAYPCCTATHTAIYAMLALRAEYGFTGEDVEAVVCRLDPAQPGILIYSRPVNGTQAKFSMEYCLAAAVFWGNVGIREFENGSVQDPGLQAVIGRIEVVPDASMPKGPSGASIASTVEVTLKDGRVVSRFQEFLPGSASQPLDDDALLNKFAKCVGRGASSNAANTFYLLLKAGSNPSFSGLLDQLPLLESVK